MHVGATARISQVTRVSPHFRLTGTPRTSIPLPPALLSSQITHDDWTLWLESCVAPNFESLSIVVDEVSRSGGDGPGAAVAVGRRHTPFL